MTIIGEVLRQNMTPPPIMQNDRKYWLVTKNMIISVTMDGFEI